MRIMQVVTDYIRRSILTTQGDFVVRGAAQPERLAAVAIGQVLKSAGVGATPAYGVPSFGDIPLHLGSLARNAGGDQVTTGLGFSPKLIIFFATDGLTTEHNFSWGFDDGTTHNVIYFYDDKTGNDQNLSASILIRQAAGQSLAGFVSAIGGDGFTITWTLVGARSVKVIYLAIG